MSNITVNRQGPEVFQDNEHGYDDSYTAHRDYKPPQLRQVDWRVYVVWTGATAIGIVLSTIVYGLWKTIYCWSYARQATCETISTVEPFIIGTLLLLPFAVVIVSVCSKLWTNVRYNNALANKANLVLNRFGDQEPADLYDRLDTPHLINILETRYGSSIGLERAVAPWKQYRGVNSLSLQSNTTSLLETPLKDIETLTPVPAEQWLTWLNDRPHVLFGAETKGGKTVAAKALLHKRIERGDQLMIIDPHSDDWFALPIRGGGENFDDVANAIRQAYEEYKQRMELRDRYLIENGRAMPIEDHQAVTILVDEAFLIHEALDTGASKKRINYWSILAEVLGSGARKVNMSVVLLSQSTNVEDLGLSGPMRQNFTRVALDPRCIKLMVRDEEKDTVQRTLIYDALIGMPFPATTVIDSQVVLLDRTGLDVLAAQLIDARSQLWCPSTAITVSEDNRLLEALRKLRAQGLTRQQVRDMGVVFDNDLWSKAL